MNSKFRTSVYPKMIKFRTVEYNDLLLKSPTVSKREAFDLLERSYDCIMCDNHAKFVSLKLGYSKYCSVDCYDLDNEFSSFEYVVNKVKSGYKLSTKHFVKLKKLFNKSPEELYVAVHGRDGCAHCKNHTNFVNFRVGFLKYCSVSCSNHYKNFHRTTEQNIKIQAKRKKTTFERYGVENNFSLIETTGVNNIMHNQNTSEKSLLAKNKKRETMNILYSTNDKHPFSHIKNRNNLNVKYLRDNFVFDDKFDSQSASVYYNCSRTYFNKFDLPRKINNGEQWIFDIIKGKRNDRTIICPLEIDVLNSQYKFGVEFNGLAFHSSGLSKSSVFNNPNRKCNHLNKTTLMEKTGFQLFHISEDEYLDETKRIIWESVLKSKMHELPNTIFARKCVIMKISKKETRDFLNANHLQSSCVSKINFGLFYNDMLISVMTFSKSRFNNSYQYELVRFCVKINHHVPGAFSKLLKHFEREYNPTSIVSYANRRWSTGALYETNGFSFSHNTQPNYFYFKPNVGKLLSRQQFQKHKLKDKLKSFDSSLTESENMYNNGYRKIYDCGNKVYLKHYK